MDSKELQLTITLDRLRRELREYKHPIYFYFTDIIHRKIAELRSVLPNGFKIYFAVKSNPNPLIIQYMAAHASGADVASGGELEKAVRAGIPAENIEFSGPAKTLDELRSAISAGAGSINAESLTELHKIRDLCKQMDRRANVGLRINPGLSSHPAGMSMAGHTPFGIGIDNLDGCCRFLSENKELLIFTGAHLHIGSQIFDARTIQAHCVTTIEAAMKMETMGLEVRKINFGGGLGIPTVEGQKPLDIEDLRERLADIWSREPYRRILARSAWILEPGRFLVAEAGVYVCRVEDIKRSEKKNFLLVDGGMHQHLAAAGGLGQVLRRNFALDVIRREEHGHYQEREIYDIAGCLCTPHDILASGVLLPVVSPGDWIIFFNSGAYGYSASPMLFLSHPWAEERVL